MKSGVISCRKSISIIERVISIHIKIHVQFLTSHFNDLSRCISKFTGWAIIEELSIRRRLRTFLINQGQKARVKHCYVGLSSWYGVLVCNNMYRYERHFGSFCRNPTILKMVLIASKWVNTENIFVEIQWHVLCDLYCAKNSANVNETGYPNFGNRTR